MIVIGIIGTVAHATIPTLIANQKEKMTVSQLKSAYSTFSEAFTLAVQENGTPDNWNLIADQDILGAENILNALAPYQNITNKCGRNTGCWPDVTYKRENNSPFYNINTYTSYAKAKLNNGLYIMTVVNTGIMQFS